MSLTLFSIRNSGMQTVRQSQCKHEYLNMFLSWLFSRYFLLATIRKYITYPAHTLMQKLEQNALECQYCILWSRWDQIPSDIAKTIMFTSFQKNLDGQKHFISCSDYKVGEKNHHFVTIHQAINARLLEELFRDGRFSQTTLACCQEVIPDSDCAYVVLPWNARGRKECHLYLLLNLYSQSWLFSSILTYYRWWWTCDRSPCSVSLSSMHQNLCTCGSFNQESNHCSHQIPQSSNACCKKGISERARYRCESSQGVWCYRSFCCESW